MDTCCGVFFIYFILRANWHWAILSSQGALSHLGGKLVPHSHRSGDKKPLQEVSKSSFVIFFLFLLATAESSGQCFFDVLQGRGCSQCQTAEQQTLRLRKLCAARLLRRGHPPFSRKSSLTSLCFACVLLLACCCTCVCVVVLVLVLHQILKPHSKLVRCKLTLSLEMCCAPTFMSPSGITCYVYF